MDISFSTLQQIGSTLGVPLAIALCVITMTLKQHDLKMKDLEKRLDDGNQKFAQLDNRLDEINGTLKELKGMFAMYLKIRSEERE